MRLSQRNTQLLQSDIRSMTIECARVKGINLAQGVCDLALAPPVADGAIDAIRAGANAYTRYDGTRELREAIAAKYRRHYGMSVDPEGEIVVSCGATGAFYAVCLALLDPSDEVILFEPYYGYHVNTVRACGGVPVFVRMSPPEWRFEADELERAVTARTRAIVVNSPANPSGKVFSTGELAAIAAVAQRHDMFVITDEIYEHFVYDNARHVPMATLPDMRGRTLTISGLSKTFSITGWRIGWVIGDRAVLDTIGQVNDLVYVCAPAPLQAGAARGMTRLGDDYYGDLIGTFTRRRRVMCDALARAGLPPVQPGGAYYVLADISRVPGADSRERAMRLLHDTGIACVPGRAFYHDSAGERLGRFCFAKGDAVLDDVAGRLAKYA